MLAPLRDRALRATYGSIFVLGIASSTSLAVLSPYLRRANVSTEAIGTLAAAFAAGGVLVSLFLGRIVRRFSAKRTLVGALAGLSATTAVLPLLTNRAVIAASRFVEGACMVAVWVAYETLLLSRAKPENRGIVSSLYGVALALGYVVGPLLARAVLVAFGLSAPFFVAGALGVVNALSTQWFVRAETRTNGAETTGADQHASNASSTSAVLDARSATSSPTLATLAWRIKTSCFAMFGAGYLKASLVLFLPLYLVEHRGITTEQPPIVLASYAAGSLVFANVAATLGDRHGHLLLMRALAAAGAAAMLAFLFVDSVTWMCVVGAGAGATLGAISPLGMALQGSIVPAREYGRATALSNGLYAAGTLVGPPLTAFIYARAASTAMVHIAVLWLAFTLFSVFAADDDPARQRARVPTTAS